MAVAKGLTGVLSFVCPAAKPPSTGGVLVVCVAATTAPLSVAVAMPSPTATVKVVWVAGAPMPACVGVNTAMRSAACAAAADAPAEPAASVTVYTPGVAVAVKPPPDSVPFATPDRVTVTVSPCPVSGSVTVIVANGLIVWRSPTVWPPMPPAITGASFALVVVTVSPVEACAAGVALSLTMTVNTVCTARPGATWSAVGVKLSASSAVCSAAAEPAARV